jgi:hypothetical protein
LEIRYAYGISEFIYSATVKSRIPTKTSAPGFTSSTCFGSRPGLSRRSCPAEEAAGTISGC